jgi:hypothetical protein
LRTFKCSNTAATGLAALSFAAHNNRFGALSTSLSPFFTPLEERQVAFLIQHHQIHQSIGIPIHRNGRRAPLREQTLALRLHPPIG